MNPMKLSYHQKYNQLLQKFSAFQIYRFVLSLAEKQGNPYPIKRRGRKPKLQPFEYAAYMAYMTLMKGAPFRTMEFESELYTDKHIDHSTFVVNFEKIPVEYYLGLVEETGASLDRLLEYSDQYVVDSTAVTSNLRFETEQKGIVVEERIEFRSHIIASIHLQNNCVCVKKVLPTTKFVADCEAAKVMLRNSGIKDVDLHGDRGYDFERVYESCYRNNIRPNIRPREYTVAEHSCRLLGITEYDDAARKRYRGIIEVVFGGLTNAGLMTTRLKKEAKILSYCAIIILRHNILNIARNLAISFELLTTLGATPLSLCCLILRWLTRGRCMTFQCDRFAGLQALLKARVNGASRYPQNLPSTSLTLPQEIERYINQSKHRLTMINIYKLRLTNLQQEILRLLFIKAGTALNQRQISRNLQVTAPAVMKALPRLQKENTIKIHQDKESKRLSIELNRDNRRVMQLKRADNLKLVYESELYEFLEKEFAGAAIILFGSYSRGEDIINSDIDIAVIGRKDKEADVAKFEKLLERRISISFYESFGKIHKHLKENLCNGILLAGGVEL